MLDEITTRDRPRFKVKEESGLVGYTGEMLEALTLDEVADVIEDWRNDDDQMISDAFDLLNAIEGRLRQEGREETQSSSTS